MRGMNCEGGLLGQTYVDARIAPSCERVNFDVRIQVELNCSYCHHKICESMMTDNQA